MSLFRPESSVRAVESLLVGFLFIFLDLTLRAGVDLVPDVIGWVMVAFAADRLRRTLTSATDPRLGTAAWALSWVSVVVTGLLLLFGLLSILGLVSSLSYGLAIVLSSLALFANVPAMLAVAALGAFVEQHARRFGAGETTLKLLRGGWIGSLAVAGLALVMGLGLLPYNFFSVVNLAALVAGVVTGFGISRCRNESVI